MEVEYFFCYHCSYEAFDIFVAYVRTTASGNIYSCPRCKDEVIKSDDPGSSKQDER